MSTSKAYWKVCPIQYFINACLIEEFRGCKFYFFSDEIDWVEKNIIPRLSTRVDYEIVRHNGSDKGYMDLLLLSTCNYQIASQGSFGHIAYFYNEFRDKKLVRYSPDKEELWEWYVPD